MGKYGLSLEVVEKLLKRKDNQTGFEIKNNIFCEGAERIYDRPNIKFYTKQKSDGTKTLTIVYYTPV